MNPLPFHPLPGALVLAVLALACGPGTDAPDQGDAPPDSTARREVPAAPLPDGPLTGLVVHLADPPTFTECTTGRRFPLAPEGRRAEVERRYFAARAEPGAPVRMTLRARTAPAAAGDAAPEEGSLVVEEIMAVGGGAGCGETPPPPLEGTVWRMVEAVGRPVSGVRVTLAAQASGELSLTTGCGTFEGRYRLEGSRLTFSALTPMGRAACEDAEAQAHTSALEALRVAGSWRFVGRTLELQGEAGAVARLEPGNP